MSKTLGIMVNLILYGDIKDKSITSKLCRVLSDYGGVLYFSNTKANKYGNFDDISFLIYECNSLKEIAIPNCLVIFKSKQTSDYNIKICNSAISIMESNNQMAIKSTKGNINLCVSCGMSSNDTVTLSSINDTTATISIQRSITDFNLNIIEPCDVKVKFKSFCDGFTLFSTFCSLILSGHITNGTLEI